jgi:hypothetical protein
MATMCGHHVEAFGFMNKIFYRKTTGYVEIISGLEMQTAPVVTINEIDHDGVEKKHFPPLPRQEATEPKSAATLPRPEATEPKSVVVRVSPGPSPSPVLITRAGSITTTKASSSNLTSKKERPKILAALMGAVVCLVVGGSEAAVGPLRIVMNAVATSLYGFVWYKALRSHRNGDNDENSKVTIGAEATNTNPSRRNMLMSF